MKSNRKSTEVESRLRPFNFLITLLVVILMAACMGGYGEVLSSGSSPSYKALPTVCAAEDGYNICSYGQFDVYSVSPTYVEDLRIQESNDNPFKKVMPKKSWEIKSNFIGLTGTRLPTARAGEIAPYQPLFFVDDNSDTVGFAGKPQGDPAITRAWVRIDLPRISKVESVSMLPKKDKVGYPSEFEVRVCKWGLWHHQDEWQIAYHVRDNKSIPIPVPENTAPAVHEPVDETGNREGWITYRFDPVEAREIWITSPKNFFLAGIEVRDTLGKNIALISKGAGVSVSKDAPLFWLSEDNQRHVWPLNYDLGIKWHRNNYALSPLIWPFVEREKGEYTIDPYTDEIITESVRNGIEVCLALVPTGGHPLYKSERESIRGYCNYVRFMVNHFKDRVSYWEIGNEFYNQSVYEKGKSGPYVQVAEAYTKVAIPAAKVIREQQPSAKIILVGPCPMAVDFIEETLKRGMAPLVDVISWHPYSMIKDTDDWYEPEELDRPMHPWAGPELGNYRDMFHHLQRVAAKYGFKGEFMANEAGAYSIHQNRTSSLISTKLLARSVLLHTDLGIPVFWNEMVSLLRPAWQPFWNPTEPIMKPDYSYYVMRTLCTLTDGIRHADIKFDVACEDKRIEKCSYVCPNGDTMIAFWIREKSRKLAKDDYPPVRADVFVPGIAANSAVGYELLNGQEQDLKFTAVNGGTNIRNLLVRDYPLVIRLRKSQVQ